MDLRETANLLRYVNLHDKRLVDELVIRDWQDLLGDLEYSDCYQAVREHRMNSTEYLLPVHIRRGAKRFAEARRRAQADQHPAIESGPAAFQRSPEQQAEVQQNIARMRQVIAEVTGGKPMPEADDRWKPVPLNLGPKPPKDADRELADRLEAERLRQLKALEAAIQVQCDDEENR